MTTIPDYYNRINPDLLALLPMDAKLIVEVGCGAGAMGEAYKRLNPHAEYVGIEVEPEPARVAESRLDRVVTGSIEELDANAVGVETGTVDCLVYGDVLEHLIDPWSVLARHAHWLREGGRVCACIPNIQHYSVLIDLLRGKWEYQDEGLLDRTHMRFFTFSSIQQMFERANLRVYDLKTRKITSPDWHRFRELLSPALQALGVDLKRFALQSEAFQYLVVACRGETPKRRMFIQTRVGCPVVARVRVSDPDAFNATVLGVRTFASEDSEINPAQPDEQKVFVFQRRNLLYPNALPILRQLLAQGFLILTEFDDDPDHWPEHKENQYLTFRGVHAVQTSTEKLAEFFRELNPNVAVFANQLSELPSPRVHSENAPIRLFFGAINREEDRQEIVAPLNRILADYGERVRVCVLYDQGFFDELTTSAKEYSPYCPYRKYLEILRSCDIGLLPLRPTRFNAMKSDGKFIECAGHGVVALASPVVYEQTLRDGETGVLFRSPEEFEAKLRHLLDHVDERRRIANAAYDYVKNERLLCQHYRQRTEWYTKLLDELPRLNAELRERMPELFQ